MEDQKVQKYPNNIIRKEISTFTNFKYWQLIFIRIYFFSLFLYLFTENFYSGTDVPLWLNILGWSLASIGIFPFVFLSVLIIMNISKINRFLYDYQIKKRMRDWSILFFMLTMILLLIEPIIPFFIEIFLILGVSILSELNFRKNKEIIYDLNSILNKSTPPLHS